MSRQPITTEEEWWDQFGSINESLWNYDAYLHQKVRAPYLKEMFDFLYKKDGRLLDFGCGTGWVSLIFAQQGMHVEGIDLSTEQVARAQREAQLQRLASAHYTCGTVDTITAQEPFDSAIVHSLLHHLPEKDKGRLLAEISESLIEGGRLFLYEPMAAAEKRPLSHLIFDKGMIALFRSLRLIALSLNLFRPEVDQLERRGWQMVSPDESPLAPDQLFRLIPPDLTITQFRYIQAYSVKYANFCMGLKPQAKLFFQYFITLFCWLDSLILTTPLCPSLNVWPMAICLLEKHNPKSSNP